ncbi:MAG: hypothetical protein ACLQHK_09885 [Gallionellaceae bacterium]
MNSTGVIIGSAIGYGIVQATIGFPITYIVMRKQFKLRSELRQAWIAYIKAVLVFCILHLLGLVPPTDSSSALGAIFFLLFPVSISAAVIYLTHRSIPIGNTSNLQNSGRSELFSHLIKAKRFNVYDNSLPVPSGTSTGIRTVSCSKLEIRAFRCLIFVWIICLGILAFAGYAKYNESLNAEFVVENSKNEIACKNEWMGRFESCNVKTDSSSKQCFEQLKTELPSVFRLPRGGVYATSFSFC